MSLALNKKKKINLYFKKFLYKIHVFIYRNKNKNMIQCAI